MSYEIRLHPKAASFLNRCNQATKEQLKSKIRVLENHPKLVSTSKSRVKCIFGLSKSSALEGF
jgi:mRNA-degrading endonuclease RelE of RelBE toxin-antitoxin system